MPGPPEKQTVMATMSYRELVGTLLYLTVATRPNISYTVGVLCRFAENPGPLHWAAVKHVLRYLRGSVGLKLVNSRSTSPDKFAGDEGPRVPGCYEEWRESNAYIDAHLMPLGRIVKRFTISSSSPQRARQISTPT